jgi:hypothetical protein
MVMWLKGMLDRLPLPSAKSLGWVYCRYSWLKICVEIAAVAVVLAGYAYKNKDKSAQVTFSFNLIKPR